MTQVGVPRCVDVAQCWQRFPSASQFRKAAGVCHSACGQIVVSSLGQTRSLHQQGLSTQLALPGTLLVERKMMKAPNFSSIKSVPSSQQRRVLEFDAKYTISKCIRVNVFQWHDRSKPSVFLTYQMRTALKGMTSLRTAVNVSLAIHRNLTTCEKLSLYARSIGKSPYPQRRAWGWLPVEASIS